MICRLSDIIRLARYYEGASPYPTRRACIQAAIFNLNWTPRVYNLSTLSREEFDKLNAERYCGPGHP